MISITALEFSYTQAPNEMKSFIMGLYLLSVSLGNFITVGVNSWMNEERQIEKFEAGQNTYISLNNSKTLTTGHKIGIKETESIRVISGKDTSNLGGTYLVGDISDSNNGFLLWDINREPVHTIKIGDNRIEASTYKLNGSAYFYFFAALMACTGGLFTFVAFNYKEKEYIQS